MQDENDLTSKLDAAERELEAALSGLTPAATATRRDEVMFAAGARSGRRSLRIWQSTTAALAACVGVSLFIHIEPQTRDVARQSPPLQAAPVVASVNPLSNSPYSLAALRRVVQEGGVDALPSDAPVRSDGRHEPTTPSLRPQSILNSINGDPL
jgi:hypothetical protein